MPLASEAGVVWKLAAIWGSAVAMTVPSRFSMKKAPATRSATRVPRRRAAESASDMAEGTRLAGHALWSGAPGENKSGGGADA